MLNVLYSFAKNIGNLTDTSTNDKELFIVENLEFYAFIYNKNIIWRYDGFKIKTHFQHKLSHLWS